MRALAAFAVLALLLLAPIGMASPPTENATVSYGALGRIAGPLDEATARAYLAEELRLAGVTLEFEGIRTGLALTHARFIQTVAGLPVEGTRVQVSTDAEGTVRWTILDVHPELEAAPCPVAERPSVATARELFPGPLWSIIRSEHLVTFRGETVWRVTVPVNAPMGNWKVDVACDGSVLRAENAIREFADHAAARLFPVSPIVASGDPDFRDNPAGAGVLMSDLMVNVRLQGLDGSGFLVGDYASIVAPTAYGEEHVYDRADPRFEELNTYYYTDWAQRHIQSLGFDDVHNRTTTIVARLPGAYTAFYTGDPDREIFYGYHGFPATLLYGPDHIVVGKGGLADAAEDAHVIFHEYGHAVLDDQSGICCTEEAGAMHEAYGDWQAASFLTRLDNGTARGCMAPWFGSYLYEAKTGEFPCYRNLVNDMTMADWTTGDDAHFNQLIWSGALWKTELALEEEMNGTGEGFATFERLMLEMNFLLPREATLKAAVQGLLTADAVQNGGANYDLIASEFVARAIVAAADLPALDTLLADFDDGALETAGAAAVPPVGILAWLAVVALAGLLVRRR